MLPPPGVKVVQHDASRIEWVAEVPLPLSGETGAASLELELELPAHIEGGQDRWGSLEVRSRLASPEESSVPGLRAATIDDLRRDALTTAHRLKAASERFRRRALGAASLMAVHPVPHVDSLFEDEVAPALEAFRAHRIAGSALPDDHPALTTERRLADEFLSNKLLDLVSDAEHAIAELLLAERCPHRVAYQLPAERMRRALADALEQELSHRAIHGYATPTEGDDHALERFLDRASVLKKHFQEVLFFDVESYWVDHRARNWVGALVATVAAVWAFLWQIYLSRGGADGAFGLVTLGTLGALVYAAKDRMKAVGNTWLAGRLTRAYANRVTKLRAPARLTGSLDKARPVAIARERFARREELNPDPLNPSIRTARTVLLRYSFEETVSGHAALTAAGFRSIKHIFRYDLAPLFSRLDDPVKHVPVLDRDGSRVGFVVAPRCYRLPLTIRRSTGGVTTEHRVVIVIHKLGIERLDEPRSAEQ